MKKNSVKKITRLAGFALALLLLLFAVNQKNVAKVQKVNVNINALSEGETLINRNDALLRIERKFGHRLRKVAIGKLNFEAIEAELENDPFVKTAEVFIDANEILHLNIEQRRPLFRIKGEEGQDFLVDETGKKMPLSPHATPRVLVVTGFVPPYSKNFVKMKNHPFNKLFNLVEELHADNLFEPLIEQIDIDESNIYTMVPKVGDQKILLGANENLDSKLERLKVFYREGLPVEGWSKYKTINLTFDGIVVCKKA